MDLIPSAYTSDTRWRPTGLHQHDTGQQGGGQRAIGALFPDSAPGAAGDDSDGRDSVAYSSAERIQTRSSAALFLRFNIFCRPLIYLGIRTLTFLGARAAADAQASTRNQRQAGHADEPDAAEHG